MLTKIRAGSNGKFDNVVIANFTTGLDFETDRTYNWFLSGAHLTNLRFVNVPTIWKAKAPNPDLSGVFSISAAATGAGSGTALPAWAKTWSGYTNFDVADAGN